MKRRSFIQCGLATIWGTPLLSALREDRLDAAIDVLICAAAQGQVAAAVLHVTLLQTSFT